MSGREMWQFFGGFGGWGWCGLVLAMGLLSLLGVVTLLLVQRTGDDAMERLMVPWNLPAVRTAVSALSILFLLGVDTIMTAGAGALFRQSWELSSGWSCFLFSLAVAVSALTGLEGIVSAFSLLVPVLTVCAFITGVTALAVLPPIPVSVTREGAGWLFSAAAFAAYNMFGSVAILAPLGKYADRKQICGALQSGLRFFC